MRVFVLSCYFLLFCMTTSAQEQKELINLEFIDTAEVYKSIEELEGRELQVIHLKLKRDKLTEVPIEIQKLKNLQVLDLSKNKIDSIPAWIGELKHLQILDFSSNEIDSIPPEIAKLQHLKKLSFGDNYISEVPEELGQLSQLEDLDLWSNTLYNIPSSLDSLKNLKRLDMRVNNISDDVQREIIDRFPEVKTFFSYDCDCY